MKTLTIRQVPDEVHEALRLRAAADGCSMEEEARRLLAQSLRPAAKPDFSGVRAIQARIRTRRERTGDARTAAEIVRDMRNEDLAATDAKWERIDADAKRRREEGGGGV
ncbi:MAG: hypothetical protein AAFV51_00850 [Pseudomonadota bacterium]